ncbi:MAG: phosphoribosylformylglycinamidine synthase subunit PurL [Phycisphaerae bacterium]
MSVSSEGSGFGVKSACAQPEGRADAANKLWRIAVIPKRREWDAHGAAVLKDIHELGMTHVTQVGSGRLYLLQGRLTAAQVERIAADLLTDPITEEWCLDGGRGGGGEPAEGTAVASIEVHLKGGVMDPVAASTLAAIADMGIPTDGVEISTARFYRLRGVRSSQELEQIARRLLSNDCIEDVYLSGFGRHDAPPERLPVAPKRAFELRHVPLRGLDDEGLRKLSREGHLFLSLAEMKAVQAHFAGQGRDPTDLELETIAQTWSEHCVHKTLKSAIRYAGEPFPEAHPVSDGPRRTADQTVVVEYDNLLKDTIAKATHELMASGRVDWCLSVFEDNAGVIAFDERYGLAFKVETHNHPSAIEPYGGAATGVGGVIRDVLGCGLGAKPIANTDVFCVGRPDFPMAALPKGVLHPRRVLKGVVAGVRDYGNRMGIPTVNGAVYFDDRYLGNPLVFCGCVGLIPRDRIAKRPRPGDLIVVIGGRTGRDGIHGATFSSAELTDSHADEFSHAVQIGNAITEKQVLDALLRARDHAGGCLYTAVTDCGAGGLSSAVGEMGAELGAVVDLEKVPLKYEGLRYDEIWISEAQERMVLSVPPGNWPALSVICRREGVEATVIGSFGNQGRLLLRYEGKVVGELDAAFLHHGIPKTRRSATWRCGTGVPPARESGTGVSPVKRLLSNLSRLNTASKEWIIRQYDHEVQGGTLIKPLTGPGSGPSDAAVIRPCPGGASADRGFVLANGLCPELSDLDPYWMAVAAIDEALRNVVCVGGDPARTAILDNFCWGNCEDPQVLGALVRACRGCHDAALIHGTPFISGKDSLNNEFAVDPADAGRLAGRVPLHNNRLRIPETLLISAISVVDDVNRCVTLDAKGSGGAPTRFVLLGLAANSWAEASIGDAAGLHRAVAGLIREGKVLAAHDCGEDGWLTALAEMAFSGGCGVDVTCAPSPAAEPTVPAPFEALTSAYVIQTRAADAMEVIAFARALPGVMAVEIGRSRGDRMLAYAGESVELNTLAEAWRSPLRW